MKKYLLLLFMLPFFCEAQNDPEVYMQQQEAEKKWKKEHPGLSYTQENVSKLVADTSTFRPIISQKIIAQYKDKDTLTIEKYCEVLAIGKFLSNKVSITIEYGNEKSMWIDKRAKDETGQVVTFNNVIDALNYMGLRGWKLHSSLLLGSGPYVYHYIFRKEFIKTIDPPSK